LGFVTPQQDDALAAASLIHQPSLVDPSERDDVVDDVRTSRWDAIVTVTKALSIVEQQQHYHHRHAINEASAPMLILRRESLIDDE
jgi:hypothetical protein